MNALKLLIILPLFYAVVSYSSSFDPSGIYPDHKDLKNHLAVRVTSEGLKALIRQSLNVSKSDESGSFRFSIPKNSTIGSISNSSENENPMQLLSTLLGVDLSEKTKYTIKNKKIDVTGKLVNNTLGMNTGKVSLQFSTPISPGPSAKFVLQTDSILSNAKLDIEDVKFEKQESLKLNEKLGLDVKLSVSQLKIKIPKLFICTETDCNKESNSRITFSNIQIQTAKHSEKISITIRIVADTKTGKVEIDSIKTNIQDKNVIINMPEFGITLPTISLEIGGTKIYASSSVLKKRILDQRKMITQKLVEAASEAITSQVSGQLNGLLATLNIKSSIDSGMSEFEISNEYEFSTSSSIKKTSPFELDSKIKKQLSKIDSDGVFAFFEALLSVCRTSLGFGELKSSDGKTLEIGARGELKVKDLTMIPSNEVGPGFPRVSLGTPDFSTKSATNAHVSMAIAEPLINSALSVFHRSGITEMLLKNQTQNNEGIALRKSGIKVHFKNVGGKPRMFVILNLQINLMKVTNKFYGSLASASEYLTGGDNRIILPLEFEYEPEIFAKKLRLRLIRSPYEDEVLHNTFGYTMQLPSSWGVDYFFKQELSNALWNFSKDSVIESDEVLEFGNTDVEPVAVEYNSETGHLMIHANFTDKTR